MKGVIVQVGKPKSIVLFNNGKISAIPTPIDAHVGMVVTVNLNNRAKVLAVVIAALLVLTAGIAIGMTLAHSKGKKLHETFENKQRIERPQETRQSPHDTKDYSFQKGKDENKMETK